MKELDLSDMGDAIGHLDTLVEEVGELIVNRGGKAIARILPVAPRPVRPDHADLRARMPRLPDPSAVFVRGERDER